MEQRANFYTIGNVLGRRERFEAEHPDITITPPSETLSDMWEVSAPGADLMAFTSGQTMMDALEELYHEIRPITDSWYTTLGKPTNPDRSHNYPIEAVCSGCHKSIKKETIDGEWQHFTR